MKIRPKVPVCTDCDHVFEYKGQNPGQLGGVVVQFGEAYCTKKKKPRLLKRWHNMLRPGGDRRFPDPVQSEKQTARCKQHGCRQSRRDDLLFHILISDSISKFLNSMIFRISASRIRA